ncbi:uncharacterized protein BO87DRAFT_446684 [Aspergillus neoniger CBS 115656]|uniref:Integral membrane protein n=1 Tax=Aspergillus neoniger (strain CBS 115656) TaxID=1448310 RepID=A0A318Y6L4_ASPNB|nr:integral membrane protein [Aspergillus neoniger CBS 115656]PYH29955.1 integral membrane protein [Aspergillus neoniger CBS 115656]
MWLDDIGSRVGSQLSRPVTYVITSFLSIALYNVVELTFILLLTFKRRKGLYFWSFVVATWGIAIYSIGFILKDFNLVDNAISYFYVTLIVVGWCAMVTGQSMVLYSRLHLVVRHHIMLRFILGMIICDVILLQLPTVILCYGANSSTSDRFVLPYAIYERIQVTVFFIQESIISGVYVYETFRLLRSEDEVLEGSHREAARRLMLHLILMNIIVIFLDTAILVLEWVGRYAAQTAVKGFIYSVKLKLEFDILNQLVTFVYHSHTSNSGNLDVDSSSRNLWDMNQQTEPNTTSARHLHPRHCAWASVASRVRRDFTISAEKKMSKIIQYTRKQSDSSGSPQDRGSVRPT